MRRYKAKSHKDKKIFRTTADKVEKHNITQQMPRGGIRL